MNRFADPKDLPEIPVLARMRLAEFTAFLERNRREDEDLLAAADRLLVVNAYAQTITEMSPLGRQDVAAAALGLSRRRINYLLGRYGMRPADGWKGAKHRAALKVVS